MSEGDGAKAPRQVQAGGETYTISKFKGYKAFRIGRQMTELGEVGPAISEKVSAFVKQYRENNVDRIPRATLEFRYPADAAGVSDEAWKESGGVIELASDPSQAEILAVALPAAFTAAGDKVVDLLAWIIASDSELEAKDDEGEEAVREYIEKLRKRLLFRADIDELFDLAVAARDVLSEQMAGKAEQAQSLLALVGLNQDDSEEPAPEPTEEDERQVATVETLPSEPEPELKDSTPSTPESPSTSEKPASSTDSPPHTDGVDERSSTATPGEPSLSTSA